MIIDNLNPLKLISIGFKRSELINILWGLGLISQINFAIFDYENFIPVHPISSLTKQLKVKKSFNKGLEPFKKVKICVDSY